MNIPPGPLCLQATGAAVHAATGGQHAARAAAYRGLVQQLLGLNVRDNTAVEQLAAEVLRVTGGGGEAAEAEAETEA